jgi:dolichyl-diphosphooligosaccharide--protein glycosyltransferase
VTVDTDTKKDRTATGWILLLIFAVAVTVRSLPFHFVFDGGDVFFFEGDCYMHLRKILLHIKNFPSFVTFDYFEGYPVGTPAISPPLLDYLLSAASMLIGLGNPSVGQVETLAALVPPLTGGLTAVAVYFLAKSIFSTEAALISAALTALMPAHIEFSILGRFDNEMMEPLMVTVLFFSFIRLQKGRSGLSGIVLCSLAAFFTLLFWRGATIWIIFVAFMGLVDVTADFMRRESPWKGSVQMGSALLILSACLFLMCYFNVWGTQDSFSFNIISWFHTAVFSAASAATFIYGYTGAAWLKRGWPKAGFFACLTVAVAAAAALAFLLLPSLGENLAAGFGMLGIGKKDPWIQSIMEYKPLLSGQITVAVMHRYFGWVFWLIPFIVGYMCYCLYKNGHDKGKMFFVMTAVYVVALTLMRRRFWQYTWP